MRKTLSIGLLLALAACHMSYTMRPAAAAQTLPPCGCAASREPPTTLIYGYGPGYRLAQERRAQQGKSPRP